MNDFAGSIITCLQTARLLPPLGNPGGQFLGNMKDRRFRQQDLMPLLVQQWKTATQRNLQGNGNSQFKQRWRLLRECQVRGGKLLLDASFHFGRGFQRWLGWRFCWYPYGIPTGQLVGIASSRLGRRLDTKPGWFQKLRQYCQQLDPHTQLLLTVSQTAAAPYVARAAQLFRLPCLQTTVVDSARWRYWGKLVWDTALLDQQSTCWSAIVSPVVDPLAFPIQPLQLEQAPAHDRILVSASDLLWSCQLRPQGILQQLMNRRVASCWSSRCSIRLEPAQSTVYGFSRNEGQHLPLQTAQPSATNFNIAPAHRGSVTPSDLVPASEKIRPVSETELLASPWQYLSHWTRRQDGPWPDQNRRDWLDELILEHPGRNRSALASLRRIVCQQKLLATDAAIRGGHQVVCFSATPLARWSSLRTYRAHRSRWDFEPYGICIKRKWLEQHGARPVIYGDNDDWKQLAEHQRPFFQHRFGHKSSRTTRWDWSIEQEWRYPANLSLKKLPTWAGFVFVPSREQASSLANYSRWPVVYLDTTDSLAENKTG